jgi:hypothetical protein
MEKSRLPGPPTTIEELRAALQAVAFERKPRTPMQLERQYRAFMLHVAGDATIREVARALGVSKNTVLADLYYEGRRRADKRHGRPLQREPEQRITFAEFEALVRSWAPYRGFIPSDVREAIVRMLRIAAAELAER